MLSLFSQTPGKVGCFPLEKPYIQVHYRTFGKLLHLWSRTGAEPKLSDTLASQALQLNCYTTSYCQETYKIYRYRQEINTVNTSDLFLTALTTFSPALNLQGFHSSADLESILMSNSLRTDEERGTQELPPSHLSVHRSNRQPR